MSLYGKIDRKEIYAFVDNKDYIDNAKLYFGNHQPTIFQTGWYSAPSWNWSYIVGIAGIKGEGQFYTTEEGLTYGNGVEVGTTQYFEVVTQFGGVVASRPINLYTK